MLRNKATAAELVGAFTPAVESRASSVFMQSVFTFSDTDKS